MNRTTGLILFLLVSFMLCSQISAQDTESKYDVFSFTFDIVLPGSPELIYDNITGDISGWWDHSFSEQPDSFFIEPFPGGGFYEYFDNLGNGHHDWFGLGNGFSFGLSLFG